jgi:phosphohistidine phosphatase
MADEPAHTLYLIRHAIAAERGDDWPDDTKRPLTHGGAARMRQVIKGLVALDVDVALVLSSPLARAMQTAELIAQGFDKKRPLEIERVAALAPGGSPAQVAAALGAFARHASLALVGHEPDLGELAAWLISARAPLPFKKGGVCRIDVDNLPPGRDGRLVWFATPRMLRAVAGQ